MNKRLCVCFLLFVAASFSGGCGESNPYQTIKVTGTVLVDGKPMQGVGITYVPEDRENGISAYGSTDEKGNYTLTTGGAPFGTGAKPGTYRVTFSKSESEPLAMPVRPTKMGTPPPPPKPTVYLIPKKYDDVETAGFDPVVVEKGKKNVFDFSLKSE